MSKLHTISAAAVLSLVGSLASAQAVPVDEPEPPIAPIDLDHEHPQAERVGVPEEMGQVTDALRELIAAEYLSNRERAQLRVRHGLWTDEDLQNPQAAAKAALAVGAYDHPALTDPEARPFERARALLVQGKPQEALDALHERTEPFSPSYLVTQAQAQEMLGDEPAAIESLEQLRDMLAERKLEDADEIAWSVRGLMQLTRLQGPDGDARSVYQNLAKLLASARDALDRTSWLVRLVEAELLYAHNNYEDAHKAAVEALRLHPRNARAAALIGNMAVDSFDFDTAEQITGKLDAMAADFADGDGDNPEPTLHSAVLRARIALRRKDPEGAEMAIDPVLAVMPRQRQLLELNAAAAAAGFRMTSTERLLEQYHKLSPGSPFALMRVAETLGEYRQYEDAEAMYQRVIERAPHWGEPRLKLGLVLVQAGKDNLAKSVLEEALALDPFDIRARNSLTLVTELASYATLESEHFIIRYKPDNANGADGMLAAEMLPILENIHDRVASDQPGGVDFEPARKTIIELMPNHEWFAVRIGGMPSIHTMAASTGPVIAIEAPREGPGSSIGQYDWPRVLQHEYTHTVNLARTNNRVIHWMTEANAVFNEDAPRASQTWTLLTNAYKNDELFDLVEINTAFVRPKKPTDRGLAYAQGAWMFEYIVERYGKEAPLAVFDASAAGRDAVDAFEETLGVTPESFLTEFRAWAKGELLERGLILPDGTPDIYELFDVDEDAKAQEAMKKVPTLDEINELLERYPDHPELITMQIGFAMVGSDERLNDEQVAMLERATEVRPTDDAPHRRLARHYLAGDDTSEQLKAIEHLEYLDAREVNSPAYAGQLALLYAQNNQPEQAMRKAIRAAAIAPFDADQRERAARVALLTGNLQAAQHHIEALIVLEPDREIHRRRLEALKAKIAE